jgi:hypothetical protein
MSENRIAGLLTGAVIALLVLAAAATAAERCVLAELFTQCI